MANLKLINGRIQHKTDTAANWKLNNIVLLSGEMGYESDTHKVKIGDGTTAWNNLPYVSPTKTSELINDNGFITKSIIPNELNSRFAISASTDDLTDNMTSTEVTSAHNGRLRGIAYGNGRWVAVNASGYVQYSDTDGDTWVNIPQFTTNALTAVTFGNGVYACIDYVNAGGGNVYQSINGIDWSIVYNFTQSLESIIFANGRFTVVGTNGLVAFSDDLANFTIAQTGTTNSLIGITYGKDRYVAVSSSGQIISSLDGINWFDVSIPGDTTHYRVATYGKGIFIIGGAKGTIRYSTNGVDWNTAISNSTATSKSYTRALAYYNGKFFAALQHSEIWTSVDGINWTAEKKPAARWTIGCANDIVLVGGDNGTISKYNMNIEWFDYEPSLEKDEVLWQKQFITLSNGVIIESEPEVHTNLTNLYNEINNRSSIIEIVDLRG